MFIAVISFVIWICIFGVCIHNLNKRMDRIEEDIKKIENSDLSSYESLFEKIERLEEKINPPANDLEEKDWYFDRINLLAKKIRWNTKRNVLKRIEIAQKIVEHKKNLSFDDFRKWANEENIVTFIKKNFPREIKDKE